MKTISYKFVTHAPRELEEDTLYISIEYKSALHKCFCGCGKEVVTPLSPAGWKLTFDGVSVSLYPSIGNWALPCKSHYWITENEVLIAPKWSERQIDAVRKQDKKDIEKYFDQKGEDKNKLNVSDKKSIWTRIKNIFS